MTKTTPKKKEIKIKALALIGADRSIATIADIRGAHTGQLAVYDLESHFSTKIVKDYKLTIVPCTISYELKPQKQTKLK